MGLFGGSLLLEERHDDDDDVKLIRDKRGRLAVSRPCTRPRKITPPQPPAVMDTKGTNEKSAETKDAVKSKPSKESLKAAKHKKSKDSLKVEWGPAEDLRLLELRSARKSWDYIAGKLDDKGKDMTALKARFNELTLHKAKREEAKTEQENKKDKNEGSKEEEQESSSEKGKEKKRKEKKEDIGAESDGASRKSERGSSKASGILKASLKDGSDEAEDKQEVLSSVVRTTASQKEGYIGKYGRGEVRFFNGVPVLYKHAGSNAEPLDAEAVAMILKEAAKYERNKWLTIVSRVFDKTGISMDPEVVRLAVEGI